MKGTAIKSCTSRPISAVQSCFIISRLAGVLGTSIRARAHKRSIRPRFNRGLGLLADELEQFRPTGDDTLDARALPDHGALDLLCLALRSPGLHVVAQVQLVPGTASPCVAE